MAEVTLASSYEEMKKAFPEFYLKKKVDELKANFKKYDINGDGTLLICHRINLQKLLTFSKSNK